MRPGSQRYLLVIALLLLAAALSWGQRWAMATREVTLPGAPDAGAARTPPAGAVPHVYFVDVEGWYRITPYEAAVQSPYDLTGGSSEAVAAAIPARLGEWHQVGDDQFTAGDPAIVYYLNHPTVALQRVYQEPSGQAVTLAIVGNEGEDSFLLFSHTPETCYPGRLWQVVENRRESALLDERPMYAQYLLTRHAETGEKLMVLYWYLWDDPQRNSKEGVLSIRVNLFVSPGQTEDEALARAWDFVRALFPATVPWQRF